MVKKMSSTLFLSFFMIFTSVHAQEIKKDFHKSFAVREGTVLILHHGDGDVTVLPWDKDVIDVSVRYRAEYKTIGLGNKHDFDVEFRRSGDKVYVIGKERGGGISIGIHYSRRYEYTYKIRAPKYIKLEFAGDDGEVEIDDWQGDIFLTLDDGDVDLSHITAEKAEIKAEDGTIRVSDLNGLFSVRTDDGDVYLENCDVPECRIYSGDGEVTIRRSTGNFDITTDDGDILLRNVRTERLDIRCSDADVDLDLLKSDRVDYDIVTDDGNVILDFEPEISARFWLDSDGGKVRVSVPDIENYKQRKYQKSGEMYGGKGKIRIRTNDGNISLRELK